MTMQTRALNAPFPSAHITVVMPISVPWIVFWSALTKVILPLTSVPIVCPSVRSKELHAAAKAAANISKLFLHSTCDNGKMQEVIR